MSIEEFNKLMTDEILPEAMQIMDSKGLSYSGQEDKLGNFRRGSKLAGLKMEQVWFVYFVKHFDSLCSYLRGEYTDSEPIRGRILDMMNYLFLLCGILREKGEL
jgi:hypothetical protein